MLAADQMDAALEGFGQNRVVQFRENQQQRAASQAQPDEGTQLIEIRGDQPLLHRVKRIAADAVMALSALRRNEALHAVAEADEPEPIALALGRDAEQQARRDEALQNRIAAGGARREPRRIDQHVNFLRLLDLKHFGDWMASPRSGLPMNLIEAVAGAVLPELLELPSLADLPLHVRPNLPAVQQQRRGALAIAQQIGIDADLAIHRGRRPDQPEAQLRRRLEIAAIQPVRSALAWRASPIEPRCRGPGRQDRDQILVLRNNFGREREAQP